MFVEHKEQGEVTEAPAKTMKLSEAIRIGCAWVQETRLFSGCAIGTGYRARTGRDLNDDADKDGRLFAPYSLVSEAFGIPYEVVKHASDLHFSCRWTRPRCADWLESQGF
jgi:hypothetical protein